MWQRVLIFLYVCWMMSGWSLQQHKKTWGCEDIQEGRECCWIGERKKQCMCIVVLMILNFLIGWGKVPSDLEIFFKATTSHSIAEHLGKKGNNKIQDLCDIFCLFKIWTDQQLSWIVNHVIGFGSTFLLLAVNTISIGWKGQGDVTLLFQRHLHRQKAKVRPPLPWKGEVVSSKAMGKTLLHLWMKTNNYIIYLMLSYLTMFHLIIIIINHVLYNVMSNSLPKLFLTAIFSIGIM